MKQREDDGGVTDEDMRKEDIGEIEERQRGGEDNYRNTSVPVGTFQM